MGHLALSFLGGFTVIHNAEPVTLFGSDKVRALLAYLSMEAARPQRRTELAAMFWPELSEKKASHNLSQSLLRLRQALQEKRGSATPSFLTVTTQDVQFNQYSDYQLDVVRFREYLHLSQHHQHAAAANCTLCADWLSHAAALYQGDFLAGLFVPDSVAFEEWRLLQQEELHQQALETLRRLTVYHQRRGELELVQTYARRQIALEPWREEAHVQLMQALAQSGQIAAALNQYEMYQRTLAHELGVKPAAHVTALYDQIRSGAISPIVERAGQEEDRIWLSAPGERRQVTILACNRVTPDEDEDFPERIAQCYRHCEATFHRFGGQRTQRHGTTCLIYFGYPQAYEDAARRAVHSGLAIAAAASEQNSLRIGIHTGPILVGEKRGPRWQDRDMVGNTIEIVRDCQRLAEPGQVVITETTQRLLQTSFDLQRLAATVPDAAGQLIPLYHVQGETGIASRLDWLAQTQRLTSFTGREAELHQLETGWERVRQGVGQAILLCGEPGIGKSRLIWELKKRIRATTDVPVRWLTAHCLSHYQNSSLYPMVRILEQLLNFQTEDPVEVRRTKLDTQLVQYDLHSPAALWLLSHLLGVPTDAPATETISKAQREQMRKLFVALLQKHAAAQPFVLVIEDLHWSDPSTVEWLGQSLDSLAAAPCFTLLTARPGFEPAWLFHEAESPHPHLLSLHPIPSAQAAQIVADLAGEQLPHEIIHHHIVTPADGIPLFLEELTKTVLEQLPLQDAANLKTPIPVTLLDSLAARLDHLGAAKETAQWLAILGRDVSYAVLQACVPYDETRLQTDLVHLIEAELIAPLLSESQVRQERDAAALSGHIRYTFKHALVQEAAYGAMLKRTRQTYHQRIAATLETHFPSLVASRPELMAHHFAQAGSPALAADYWIRAGEHATNQGALLEARIFFDHALDAIPPDDHERRWRALMGRESALFFQGEQAAQEADIVALCTLAQTLDNALWQAQAHIRQARFATAQANYREQLAAAERAIAAARQAKSVAVELEALAYKVTALMRRRERQDVAATVRQLQTLVEATTDDSIRAYAMAAVAIYHIENGDLAGAARSLSQSLESASRAPTRYLDRESQYYGHLGFTYTQLGLYEEAEAALTSGIELAMLLGISRYQAYHQLHQGAVAWRRGDLPTALALEEHALAEYTALGEPFGAATCRAYLGYMYESAGNLAQAEKYLDEADQGFTEIGVSPDKFELKAVQARISLRQGQVERANQLTQEVWHYLCHEGTEGLDSPSRLYVCLADVLEQVDSPVVTLRELVERGYGELVQRAEKLSHPAWRHSFLKNVLENRILIERWEALHRE